MAASKDPLSFTPTPDVREQQVREPGQIRVHSPTKVLQTDFGAKGKLIGGLLDAGISAIKATDTVIRKDIEDQAAVDQLAIDKMMTGESDVPEEVRKTADFVGKAGSAVNRGTMSESHADNLRLYALKKLENKYPGSGYTKLAAQLYGNPRASIIARRKAAASASKGRRNGQVSHLDRIVEQNPSVAPENYWDLSDEQKLEILPATRKKHAGLVRAQNQFKQVELESKARSSKIAADKAVAGRSIQRMGIAYGQQLANTVIAEAESTKDPESSNLYAMFLKDPASLRGFNMTAEQQKGLRQQVLMMRDHELAGLRANAAKPYNSDGSITFGLASPQAIETERTRINNKYTAQLESLENKDYGLFLGGIHATAIDDRTVDQQIDANTIGSRAIHRAAERGVTLNAANKTGVSSIVDSENKAVANTIILTGVKGEGHETPDAVEASLRAQGVNPNDSKIVLKEVLVKGSQILADKTSDARMVLEKAKYGLNYVERLDYTTSGTGLNMFVDQYAALDAQKNVKAASDKLGNPKAWRNYSEDIREATAKLAKPAVDDLKEFIANNPKADVTISETGDIVVTYPDKFTNTPRVNPIGKALTSAFRGLINNYEADGMSRTDAVTAAKTFAMKGDGLTDGWNLRGAISAPKARGLLAVWDWFNAPFKEKEEAAALEAKKNRGDLAK